MNLVRCSGCTRSMGVSPSAAPLRNKVYCRVQCVTEPAVGTNETRDAVISELSRRGRTDGQIAALFGIGRSRVQQIAAARR